MRNQQSLARLGDLLQVELLRVQSGQALAATTTPGTGHFAGLAAEVGDDLAAAVTGHTDAWLLGLGCHRRLDLILLVFLGGGATA